MTNSILTTTAESTENAGVEFATRLQPGDVVCLYGDLGAGKTTFTQGVAKGLGINDRVISPTFSLVRQYVCSHPSITMLYHIDLYRLHTIDDVRSIGIDDILNDKQAVVLIEWAEKMSELLPMPRIEIRINHTDDGRDIEITTV